VVFADPSLRHGLYAFARIADELGRQRPDISLLVTGRGARWDVLDGCGLNLRARGNIDLAEAPADLGRPQDVARLVLVPALGWDDQSLVAIGALAQGLPVVASDRGALPEIVGDAGIVVALPGRITPATRSLPTAEEVAPWVEAIVRLWDDDDTRAEFHRRALDRAERWAPAVVERQYDASFHDLRPGVGPPGASPLRRGKAVVLVPYVNEIMPECERSLGRLEQEGVRVVRRAGTLQIDQKRNEMLSDALHDGYESALFISCGWSREETTGPRPARRGRGLGGRRSGCREGCQPPWPARRAGSGPGRIALVTAGLQGPPGRPPRVCRCGVNR
jgi:hypothetical protein